MGSNAGIKIGIAVVVLAGGAIYSRIDGDAARVSEAQKMADEGCACKTSECVDAVSQKFLAWANKHGDERVDDSDYKAVESSANRLGECVGRIEAQSEKAAPAIAEPPAPTDEPAEAPPAEDPPAKAAPAAKKNK